MYSIKLVQIKGNLAQQNFSYRLCPNTEFSTGTWQMALQSVGYETKVDINQFCNITSNFSVSKHFSESGIAENYEQPLATVHINLKKNGINKSIVR